MAQSNKRFISKHRTAQNYHIRQTALHAHQHLHTPLPPPEAIHKYDQMFPGFAKQMLNEYSKTVDHVRKMDLIEHICMILITLNNFFIPVAKILGFCLIAYIFSKNLNERNLSIIGIPASILYLLWVIWPKKKK